MLHLRFSNFLPIIFLATGLFTATYLLDQQENHSFSNITNYPEWNSDLSDCLYYQVGELGKQGENIRQVEIDIPIITQHIDQHFPGYQIVLARKLDNIDCGQYLFEVEKGPLRFKLLFDSSMQLLHIGRATKKAS